MDTQPVYKIMIQCDEAVQKFVNAFLVELKKDCETYSDVEEKLRQIEKQIVWSRMPGYFVSRARLTLEKEKNGLPPAK